MGKQLVNFITCGCESSVLFFVIYKVNITLNMHYTLMWYRVHFTWVGYDFVPRWLNELDYLTTLTSLSPICRGFVPGFVNYKKKYTRLAATSDKVYQLLAHDRWLSPGTPASSTPKAGRHDIAEYWFRANQSLLFFLHAACLANKQQKPIL
jgi:hypothetical protein